MDRNDTDETDDRWGVGRRGVLGALGLGAGASFLGGGRWFLDQAGRSRRLTALLSGANQVPPLSSSGIGTATFTSNDDGTLDFRVVVVNLDGITQAHIHEGGPDENGPVVADLFRFTENVDGSGEGFPRDATAEAPVVVRGTVEDTALVEDVLANPDNYYVNVHTVENPAGEIRGQLTAAEDAMTFTVRIENVSTGETLTTPEGSQAVPLSPGAFAVYPTPELPEPAVTETPAGNVTEAPATETAVAGTETEQADNSSHGSETPGEATETPTEATETPMVGTETPTEATETPTEAIETPTEATETPAEATETPAPTPTVTPASPAVPNPIFTPGEPERGNGLEQIAEDGDPGALAESLAATPNVAQSGVFDTPVGAAEPGPIGPGEAYEFVVTATPDQRLTFATMFIPSNDLFFAPGADGIALFDGDEPISGDVTDQVRLWDAGTEENEQPGVGPNQAPRQEFPDQGTATSQAVRAIDEVDDGFTYPAVGDVVQVTVTPGVEEVTETPGEGEPVETPAETPEETPEETPTEVPEETPTEAPEEEPEETPTPGGDGDGGGY